MPADRPSLLVPIAVTGVIALSIGLCCGGAIGFITGRSMSSGPRSSNAIASVSGQPTASPTPKQHTNPQTLKAFVTQRPQEPGTFWVTCELSDYYNYGFRGINDTHYSVKIVEMDPFLSVHGYIRKDSPDGKKIFNAVKDGRPHALKLELQHVDPKGQYISQPDTSTLSITKFIEAD